MRTLRTGVVGLAMLAGCAVVSLSISDTASAARGCGGTVCGYESDGPKTFDNACLAKRAGAKVEHQGPCQVVLCVAMLAALATQPMCGIDPINNKKTNYPNNCAAELAHATWVNDGPCRGKR